MSQHEFPPLFSHIVKTVSMLEWTVSPALVESACSNIAAWGPPEIGIKELPFLGEILEVHMYAFPWVNALILTLLATLILPHIPTIIRPVWRAITRKLVVVPGSPGHLCWTVSEGPGTWRKLWMGVMKYHDC